VQVSKISRRTIVFVGFIIGTVVASGFAVPAAANYYRFYPSLARLQLNLNDLQLKNITEYLEVTSNFTIVNPTDYKGFVLTIFRGTYEIDENNITIGPSTPLPSPKGFATQPLNKNVPINVVDTFNATNVGVSSVQVAFVIDLVLSTFLDGFGPIIVTYICQGSGGVGSCYLALISAQGSVTGPGGGRGGGV